MKTRFVLGLTGAGILGGALWISRARHDAGAGGGAAAAAASARPTPVTVATVALRDVPIYLDGLGNAQPFATVTVKSQVDGRLDKVLFREGQNVKKGDLLAQVDPRPFVIQLHQAQATLLRDNAQLRNAKLNLDRYTGLRAENLIPQQQVDDQKTSADQFQASVQSDQTLVDTARLQLDYAQIKSPIDGVTGVRLVDSGNIVHAADAGGIVVITQLDPMSVMFTLPEDDLPRVSKHLAQGPITVEAYSRDGGTKLGTGQLLLIDNEVNSTTATIRLKASFPNPDKVLWPNAFVKVRLLLETKGQALVVPAAVVQRGPDGTTYAYVVGPDKTVSVRPIEVATTQDQSALIARGLSSGDQVVVEGQSQLRPNAKVAPRMIGADRGDKGGEKTIPRGEREREHELERASENRAMSSISEPFIRRPVATTLLMLGLLLAGIAGFRKLPISALPEVDYPTIVVSTFLPGASAETMTSGVTAPLERQFGQMPSLSQMTSVSSFGSSQVTLQFTLDRDIDAAEQDVQAAINAASNLLPRTLPTPPGYSKSNPADTPILTLAISSDTLPLSQVDDFADSILAQKISQVSGVGLVTLNGGQKPAVRVQVDPEALAGTGLALDDVRQALVTANVNQPKGTLDGPRQNFTLATDDQLYKAESFRPLILAYKNGAAVRLSDVASVVDGVENSQLAGWADDKRAIILNVQRQPGANIIQVADKVKALLPQLQASLPQGIEVKVLSDRTETVRASVEDVEFTLLLTIGLVVGVIFVFLRNLRATAIPSVAVPLSLIGTFGVMYLLGYSLDNLSLMALTISTGFVVDDAIVMIENIARYIEEGKSPFEAALLGSKQIGFTIVSLTVSLVAVLIPLLFMGGVIGRLFREFAVTLSIAIGVSAILSLTLTPMMSAYMLRPEPPEDQRGTFHRVSERSFDWMVEVYDRGLKWVLAHQRTTLLATIGTLAFTALLTVLVPKGFFPQQDTGLIVGVSEAAPDISFPRMASLQRDLADVILHDPDVATVSSFIGSDGTNPTLSSGRLSVTLKPRSERRAGAEEIIERLRPRLAAVSGITVHMQSVQDLQIDTRISRTQFQYTLEDADPVELDTWSERMIERMRTVPELQDVASDQQGSGLKLSLTIDRDTAARLGVSPQMLDDTLYDAFGQRQVSTIFTQLNLYRVILEVKPEQMQDPGVLTRIYVHAQNGDPIPLAAFVHSAQSLAPLVINHQGQFPSATISFNVASGASLGKAVDAIHKVEEEIGLPGGVHASFAGAARAFSESLASEPVLILAALITVYIVLGVLYESYIHPITILSTLPSAGVGALLALMVSKSEFSIIALIGIILLIGIVKKNAIMMIDFALEAERDEKKTPQEAIHSACLLRFRPIMMTTLAALLGAVPLALGSGTGSELRRPLGISIVGGLLISQILTLYTTPVIYLYMTRLSRFLTKGRALPEKVEEVPALSP